MKLKSLALNHYDIDNRIINVINNLKTLETIAFNFCTVKANNVTIHNNFKHIILSYTDIKFELFNCPKNLLELEILNDDEDDFEIDIKDLLKFEKLKVLRIYNSKVKNSVDINKFNDLKELFLDGSLVDAKNFCKTLNKKIKFNYKNEYLFD